MSKKMRYFLFILVLVVPLVLAACGGDDDKSDDKSSGSSLNLSQTIESTSGVSVKYPEGWAAKDDGSQIMLANSSDILEAMSSDSVSQATPEKGQIGMVVAAMALADMGLPADTSVDTIFDLMVQSMSGEDMEADGETQTVKVGDADARKLNVKYTEGDNSGDGTMLAFMDSDGAFVMVIALTATGERSAFDDTVMKIAESISWAAPAAE